MLTAAAQSMNEYILPVALVGIIGISALGVMGQQLSDMFGGMVHRSQSPAKTPVSSVVTPAASSSGTAEIADLSLTLRDGSTLSLPGFPLNTAQAIETVGGWNHESLCHELENFG